MVTNICATYPENYVFGNVGGVVGYALQIACHDKSIECLSSECGIVLHDARERFKCFAIHGVDDVVALEDLLLHFGVLFMKRSEISFFDMESEWTALLTITLNEPAEALTLTGPAAINATASV